MDFDVIAKINRAAFPKETVKKGMLVSFHTDANCYVKNLHPTAHDIREAACMLHDQHINAIIVDIFLEKDKIYYVNGDPNLWMQMHVVSNNPNIIKTFWITYSAITYLCSIKWAVFSDEKYIAR